jgi:cell division protein FtsI (penicillin-binding protein 3)
VSSIRSRENTPGRLRPPPADLRVDSPEVVIREARRRVRWLGGVLGFALVMVAVRGAQLCTYPAEETLERAALQRFGVSAVQARRGDITDRAGNTLSTSVLTPRIVADPSLVQAQDVPRVARQLAEVLQVDPESIARQLRKERSRYEIIAARVHPADAVRIQEMRIPAIFVEKTYRRYYPEEQLGAQLLGFVDVNGGGVEGLEAAADKELRSSTVIEQRRQDRQGRLVEPASAAITAGARGLTVQTTIDRQIQGFAEAALAKVMLACEPVGAVAIVIDPATGDILAMANAPGFNPNAMTEPDIPHRRNHAYRDAVEPGSVFKPFTVATAIELGLTNLDEVIQTGSGFAIGPAVVHDDHPHPAVTVREIVKYSSNIGSAKLALRVGADNLVASFRRFGFGEVTGVGLPREPRGRFRDATNMRPVELATISYGQGITATALQLGMALSAIANDGVRMKPRLVTRVFDEQGVPTRVIEPEMAARVISPQTARTVALAMESVTEVGGTGTRGQVPGFRVAGKTGTAEKVKDGVYSDARIGSFIGFVPAEAPRLVIVVMVDEPTVGTKYGGIVAAPAFSEIAAASLHYLGIEASAVPEGEQGARAFVTPRPAERAPLELVWAGGAWTVPDLTGRPIRDILSSVKGAGVRLEFSGAGLVARQTPAPGSLVAPGDVLRVELSDP